MAVEPSTYRTTSSHGLYKNRIGHHARREVEIKQELNERASSRAGLKRVVRGRGYLWELPGGNAAVAV